MNSSKSGILFWVPAVLGVLLAIGVMTVFAACGPKEDGTWMHCHDTQLLMCALGVAIAVLFAVAALVKNKGARMALAGIGIACCVVAAIAPGTFSPLCMMETMRCAAVMTPFARIMGVIAGVIGVIALVRVANADKKDLPKYGRL